LASHYEALVQKYYLVGVSMHNVVVVGINLGCGMWFEVFWCLIKINRLIRGTAHWMLKQYTLVE
jgi:hypothetical protein